MTATRTPALDRYTGSLIGQCLGDALGFAVEGQDPASCAAYVERFLRADPPFPRGRLPHFEFGQYTDDSQLARELLQSYVARGRFDPADYAGRIAAIFAEGRIVGYGRTTKAAAERLAAGVPWDEAGTPPPMAGNGSAMRAGPVGLMFPNDLTALAQAAHDQGRITHADPRASAGAVAIAGAVALALQDGLSDAAAVTGHLVALARPIDTRFTDELARLPDYLAMPPEAAGPLVAKAGLEPGLSDRWQGISPFVTSSVIWSLYAVLRSPGDYWETICTAIAVGGDVDTTAAMAGAISGAANGLAALPQALAQRLNDQGAWDFDALVALAAQTHAIATA
jgi:poly(ADP-ribose) glycohydrolase ARH3